MKIRVIKKLCFLINPHASQGGGKEIFLQVKKILQENSIESKLYVSEYPGFISKFIMINDLSEFDGICVIGGDGTIHEAINGLMRSKKTDLLPLGVIGGGSGNAFAQDINHTDPIVAINKIISGKISSIDVMKIMHQDSVDFAVNIIGWGMAANINALAERFRWLGNWRYSFAAVNSILRLRSQQMNVRVDEEIIECNGLFFLALNTIHTGKGMRMAPYAKLNDGLIDIVMLRQANRLRLLKIFTQIFSGNHVNDPLVEYRQVRNFSIQTNGDALTIDGENYGKTPIDVSVSHKALKLFADL
jgi:YegS/Rv2252/BmrU family lipid kinase